MRLEQLMVMTQRHTLSVEALAALGAWLRADVEGLSLDPRVKAAVDAAVRAMGFEAGELEAIPTDQRAALLGSIRSTFRQASALVEHPENPPV